MSAQGRRNALVLLGAMAAASGLAWIARPTQEAGDAGIGIDLDKLVPQAFGVWRLDESMRAFVRPAALQGQLYGIYDQVLERAYIDDQGRQVMLSVVYGRQQSASLQLHRPEVCYRANGYRVHDSRAGMASLAGREIPVTDLRAELPGRLEPVTYWTLLGGEPVADTSEFRWRRLGFALRRKLTDGLLVRVSSINVPPEAAFELHRSFADSLLRSMSAHDQALVAGQPA